MNRINRLLIQARKAAIPSIYRALCVIRYDDITNKWIAAPQLWDKHDEYRRKVEELEEILLEQQERNK